MLVIILFRILTLFACSFHNSLNKLLSAWSDIAIASNCFRTNNCLVLSLQELVLQQPHQLVLSPSILQANLTNANLEGALVTGNTSFKGANITGAGKCSFDHLSYTDLLSQPISRTLTYEHFHRSKNSHK